MKESVDKDLKSLYIIGGVAALLQLATVIAMMVAIGILGLKPETALEWFTIQQNSKMEVVLRGDLWNLILIGLYLGTFPALYAALRRVSSVHAALAVLFSLVAVAGAFVSEATFSLLDLGDQWAAATTETQRAQFLAAGEAVIASDMWHSTGGYMVGILLQGAGVIISLVMLRSRDFSKVTAYAGLVGNALDLVQHILHPFVPSISQVIMLLMGLPYLVWFVMLGRDLLRLGLGRSRVRA